MTALNLQFAICNLQSGSDLRPQPAQLHIHIGKLTLDFDQQHALDTWKGFYMYRNLFAVHFRYGENVLVRLKPYLITLAVVLLAPSRGGVAEARNVIRAILGARGMRHVPVVARSGRADPSVD